MKLGMIGLGRMGGNMTERLRRDGHEVMTYDPQKESTADTIGELVQQLEPPRAVWIMVPSGEVTERTFREVLAALEPGDTVIDGGNSNYKESMRRAAILGDNGVHFVDVGTSGGIWGLREGYSLMVGGDTAAVERLRPVFETLAPAADRGWGHVGPSGSGHFVKMVHNGIEYGLMQAYAEGLAILQRKEEFGLDQAQIAEIWRYGSVVRSWLLDLAAIALRENPELEGIAPWVADSGEGRWTVAEAVDLDVPAPVITLSLIQRLRSRDSNSYADRLLAALRNQFGGHAIKGEG